MTLDATLVQIELIEKDEKLLRIFTETQNTQRTRCIDLEKMYGTESMTKSRTMFTTTVPNLLTDIPIAGETGLQAQEDPSIKACEEQVMPSDMPTRQSTNMRRELIELFVDKSGELIELLRELREEHEKQ